MKCDICQKTATIHLTEINDVVTLSRHLCAEHGVSQMPVLPPGTGPLQIFQNDVPCVSSEEATVRAVLDNLRGVRNFLRDHGHMPESVNDLLFGMAAPDDASTAQIADTTLQREFDRMDAQVKFIQLHGRVPSTAEEFRSLGY